MRTRQAALRHRVMAVLLLLAASFVASPGGHAAGYLGEPRDRYSVFVIGDSLAGGLWAGLLRLVRDDGRISVSGRYKEESGLARPEIYDWPRALKGIMERNRFDIAIIMIGANDGRDMRVGGNRLAYGSPEWTEAYLASTAALLKVLEDGNVAVYWVGLPPMRSPEIDAIATIVTGLHRQQAEAAGVRFVDIRAEFANADGSYAENGFDLTGEFVRLRSRNGVNLLRSGNDKLASLVLARLRQDMEAAQTGIELSEDAPAEQTPADRRRRGAAYEGPVFGKALADGEVMRIQPQDLPSPDAVAVARIPNRQGGERSQGGEEPRIEEAGLDEAAILAALRADALPGSLAEKLFSTGESPPPAPGRFDDFRRPPPAD